MSNPVFRKALDQLQQLPEPGEARQLQQALLEYSLEPAWVIVSSRLKAMPGSHSHKNYLSAFKDFLAWAQAEAMDLIQPQPHLGAEYKTYLEGKYGASQASINTRLSQARRFYKAFRQIGVVAATTDPFSILERSVVVPGQHRDYYSEAEVSRLLAQADLPGRALILFGAHVGLTTAEVLGLKWSDLALSEGSVVLKDRQLRLTEVLYRTLQPLSEQQGGGVLFTTQWPVFDYSDQNALRAAIFALCLKANVPYRAWRGLRHAAGVRYYRESGNLEQVAQLLGVENHHLVKMYQDVVVGEG